MTTRRTPAALTKKQLEDVDTAFGMFDRDGTGKITWQELKVSMSTLGASLDDEEIHELMQKVDTDGSGEIDRDEFVEIMRPIIGGQDPYEEVRKCFKFFDVSEKMRIDKADLASVMEGLGFAVSDAELQAMVDVADRDMDEGVSETEFCRLCARLNLGPNYVKEDFQAAKLFQAERAERQAELQAEREEAAAQFELEVQQGQAELKEHRAAIVAKAALEQEAEDAERARAAEIADEEEAEKAAKKAKKAQAKLEERQQEQAEMKARHEAEKARLDRSRAQRLSAGATGVVADIQPLAKGEEDA